MRKQCPSHRLLRASPRPRRPLGLCKSVGVLTLADIAHRVFAWTRGRVPLQARRYYVPSTSRVCPRRSTPCTPPTPSRSLRPIRKAERQCGLSGGLQVCASAGLGRHVADTNPRDPSCIGCITLRINYSGEACRTYKTACCCRLVWGCAF